MKRQFSASVWKEAEWYVAQCLEVDVASQGETETEALKNLRQALELHFELYGLENIGCRRSVSPGSGVRRGRAFG